MDAVGRALIVGFAAGFVAGMLVSVAKAADYCDLWAREQTRIDITTAQDFTTLTSTQEAILKAKAKNMVLCMSMDMEPYLEGDNSDEAWSLGVYQLLIAKAQAYAEGQGTEPAMDRPESWEAQCAAEYRSWDASDGTVVRRGSSERVKCPCGTDVQCGE